MKQLWLSSGLADLDPVYEYIRQDNPKAARKAFQRIRQSTHRLSRFPEAGCNGQVLGTRKLVVTGLPYLVVYRVTPNAVEILRVMHTSMNWPPTTIQ